MKILLITDNCSPTGGGAEKYFFQLKEQLQRRPHLKVYSLGFGPKTIKTENSLVLKETSSKLWRQGWRMILNPRKYWQLRRYIKQMNPDVIHLHNIKKYTISLLAAVRGYRTIQTIHDYSLLCPTTWNVHKDLSLCPTGMTPSCWLKHRRHYSLASYFALLYSFLKMRKLVKKQVTTLLTPSPLLKQYLESQGFQNASYIPLLQNPLPEITIDTMQPNYFLFVGQLEEQKGIHLLLNEFIASRKINDTLILKIAGSGSQESFLKKQIQRFHLQECVHLLGWINDPHLLKKLYEECIALIFPSIGIESFGLVITEAMGHARAVIGSNRGPTTWLVDHQHTGLLFDPLQQGDLASQIVFLANNFAIAKQYGKNGLGKLKKMFPSNEALIDSITDIYQRSRHCEE